jgi:hypothetical protein
MLVLLDIALSYLLIGIVCTTLVRWKVQPDCPPLVLATFLAMTVIFTPVMCVKHRKWPWTLTMEIWGGPR